MTKAQRYEVRMQVLKKFGKSNNTITKKAVTVRNEKRGKCRSFPESVHPLALVTVRAWEHSTDFTMSGDKGTCGHGIQQPRRSDGGTDELKSRTLRSRFFQEM